MKYVNLLFISICCSFVCYGQESCHWVEVEGTPGSEAFVEYYFSDGAILAYVDASDQIAISEDKGLTWRFSETGSSFLDSHFTSFREDLNGNFYFTTNSSKHIYQLSRATLNFELIYSSNQQIFNYGVSNEFLYGIPIIEGDLRKIELQTGSVVDTVISNSGIFKEVFVSNENEILLLTSDGGSVLLNEELQILNEVDDMGPNNINILDVNVNNQMARILPNGFEYSIDYGLTWDSIDLSEINYPDFLLGNEDAFVIADSAVYVYNLDSKIWTDTIGVDTYLNLESATDVLYTFPGNNNYPFVLHYLDADLGLVEVNHQIGPPDVYDLIALNDSTFFIRDDYIFYQGGNFVPTKGYQKMVQLSSGELVASTYDSLYIAHDGTNNFSTLSPPVAVRDGVTKDEGDRLFIFRYNGIWISTDKGITWNHECPAAYFPGFDVYERSVKPKASNIYYGFSDLNNILSYNHNVDDVKFAFQNPSLNLYSINQFEINSEGHIYCTITTKATNKVNLVEKVGNRTTTLTIPEIDLSPRFAMNKDGELFIHDGKSIFKSKDAGITWIDITNNIPSTVTINNISIADDYTIYLACKNGNVYKCGLDNVVSTTTSPVITSFEIYPNPVKDILNIKVASPIQAPFQIYSMQGILQEELNVNAGDNVINISALPKGMYFVKADGSASSLKFIKQ